MKIYLDVCAIQRPLDTPSHIRILLESEAVLAIISLFDSGQAELISSEALIYESEQASLLVRKEHSRAVLSKARQTVFITSQERVRAILFNSVGVKPLDALHLALAESAQVDYFCTCDDQLLRSIKRISDLQIKVIDPINLAQELDHDNSNSSIS